MTGTLAPLRGTRATPDQVVNQLLCKRCGTERTSRTREDGSVRRPEADVCQHCMRVKPVDATSRARWVPLAACRTPYRAEVFNEAGDALTGPAGHKTVVVQEAKSYCAECPVIAQCLAFAMHHEGSSAQERWGVQGGLTPKERERRYYSNKMEER